MGCFNTSLDRDFNVSSAGISQSRGWRRPIPLFTLFLDDCSVGKWRSKMSDRMFSRCIGAVDKAKVD
jgi:hypothetical protein